MMHHGVTEDTEKNKKKIFNHERHKRHERMKNIDEISQRAFVSGQTPRPSML
jgi:hypothetical protein